MLAVLTSFYLSRVVVSYVMEVSMTTTKRNIGVSYLRLSDEDKRAGESSSITNQRRIIKNYCEQNNITLINEFSDDGWSGGNFERPGFQQMMRELQKGKVSVVITKDLSRLGRDMRESSYYAEQFFPENGIRYIAISDNFDTDHDNILAPFQFAMNEVYLRDGSKKIKDVFKSKREQGLYCACPPYGYKKQERNNNLLVPDPNTAPIVQKIFEKASQGDSSRRIAALLNNANIIPPLKYRVMFRDNFNERGAQRATDYWNHTTVKRILKNEVYLGHTILGKTKKASIKSKKKIPIEKKDWVVTKNTHEPLVTQEIFERAQQCLGKNTKSYLNHEHVRKSIFSGIIYCGKCGSALCSCGSVYNGEREKYWYLSCTKKRKDVATPCDGVRIKYTDIIEIVKNELNCFLDMTKEEYDNLVKEITSSLNGEEEAVTRKKKIEKAEKRISILDKAISKLYLDNAEGKIDDVRFATMLKDFETETKTLQNEINELTVNADEESTEQKFNKFFNIIKHYTHIETLTEDTLLTFVDRIEVGEKRYLTKVKRDTHNSKPFEQEIRIFYKFIGDLQGEKIYKKGGEIV
jgi:DNA invertase Pin-like site-specific DNA recombinase